jgi:hypothetical protein
VTPPRRRGRQRGPWRLVLVGLLVVLVFAIGIAFGEALDDNPPPAHTITQSNTFTLEPESSTVTVTTP